MRILILPSVYTTPQMPHRGRTFLQQAKGLHRRGHQVAMLVPPSRVRTWHGLREIRDHWRQAPEKLFVTLDDGVAVYRMLWWGWLNSVFPSFRGALALRAFNQYCQDYGMPDVLYARGILYGGYIGAKIKETTGLPLVVMEEFSTPYLRGYFFFDQRAAVRYTLGIADSILAMSMPLAEALKPMAGNRKIELLANSIDTDFFSPNSVVVPQDPFVFACVARLDANKGMDLLLRAFARSFAGGTTRLKIVGDGPELPYLLRLAESLHITSQMDFLGFQPPSRVREIMRYSHVVVSSSHVETFGNTLIEAMACGKPVVATASGGPNMIITEQTGILVPVGDEAALASALSTIVQNYGVYDPAKIRADCTGRFSEDIILSKLEAIFETYYPSEAYRSI